MKYNALIVEDDLDIASLLQEALSQLDIQSEIQSNGKNALQQSLSDSYDIVLLDVMLSGTSGFDICRALRSQKPDQVIFMITSKNSELDRIKGLELGADDYINKPFSVRELQARIKGQLRKMDRLNDIHTHDDEVAQCIEIDEFYLDSAKRIVKISDTKIDLTSIEFDLLYFFAKSPLQVFTRNELLDHVWGSQHSGYEHTVNTNINRLRNKIELDPSRPKWIHTVWGVGYKFHQEDEL